MQLVMTTILLPGFGYKQVGKETFKPPLQIKQTFSLKAKKDSAATEVWNFQNMFCIY